MNSSAWRKLDTAIRIKRKRENIFIGFEAPKRDVGEGLKSNRWGNLEAELTKVLRCLPQFWIDPGPDQACVLLMSEENLEILLNVCIELIEGYRKHVSSN